MKFQITTSSTNFPSYDYYKELINNPKIISKYPSGYNITLEDLKQSLISFEIYYNEMTYTLMLELPKIKIVDLVANLGGILGLFIGISVLSFVEILEIILEIFIILFEKNKV